MGFPGKLPHTHLLLSLTPPARSSCSLLLPSYWQAALCSSAGLQSRPVPLNNPKSQRGGGGGGGGTKRAVTPALTTGAEGKFNGQKKSRMKSEGREDGLLSETDKCKRAMGHMTSGRSLSGAGQVTAWKYTQLLPEMTSTCEITYCPSRQHFPSAHGFL